MSANIRETKIAWGYKLQSALQTANVVGSLWSLSKTNAALANVDLRTEDDAAWLGKGHEFATQNFKTSWDVSTPVEKFVSSEMMGFLGVFGLGKFTFGSATYTCTPQDNVVDGIELKPFTYAEQIRTGADAVVDRALIGMVVDSFQVTIGSGPGLANSRVTANFVGCGKKAEPSTYTFPAATAEHLLRNNTLSFTVQTVDLVTQKNIVSVEYGWANNLRLDSGFFPGCGFQEAGNADSGAIRGRMEFGDRAANLRFVARFDKDATELDLLTSQATGTAVIGLTGATGHSVTTTFQMIGYRTAVVGDSDGIVTISCEMVPMYHATNGVITMVVENAQTGIGSAEA